MTINGGFQLLIQILLFAKGLAIGKNFDVNISEPNVNIMAVQGPKSFSLMSKVFGKKF